MSSIVTKNRSRLFEEILLKSWWVIIFLLISFFLFERAMKQKGSEELQLKKKLADLGQEREIALGLQEELKMQLDSQGDSAWIELVLMKGLGLVPEGQTKVYFVPRCPTK